MRLSRISFSWLLPVLELVFCFTILFAPRPIRFWYAPRLKFSPEKVIPVESSFPMPDGPPSQPRFLPPVIVSGANRQSDVIFGLNSPGALLEGIVELATVGTEGRSFPPNLTRHTWRMLILPFCCLPAWWLVGRGLDALFKKRRLHWGFLLTGSIFFLLWVTLTASLQFTTIEPVDNAMPLWSARFWTILFATLPAAWILQKIRRRRYTQPQG